MSPRVKKAAFAVWYLALIIVAVDAIPTNYRNKRGFVLHLMYLVGLLGF
jgi:hypothetical protein